MRTGTDFNTIQSTEPNFINRQIEQIHLAVYFFLRKCQSSISGNQNQQTKLKFDTGKLT